MRLRSAFVLFAGTCLAAAAPSQSLLPPTFAGWQKSTSYAGKDAAAADAANAALLKEFGFTDSERATYQRDGRKLEVRAARFNDATGAFGMYSIYGRPEMKGEAIGDRTAENGDHVLFLRANILVDAQFEHPNVMSAAELRELAGGLPVVGGGAATLPTLLSYLPQASLIEGSVRYVVGPLGLSAIGAPLQPPIVDFDRSAEVVTAQYRTANGAATLVVVSYPTPQIALDRLRALSALLGGSNAPQTPGVRGAVTVATPGGEVTFRRSGPLLIHVSGAISASNARLLAESVNYAADVTWTERPPVTTRALFRLIAGIFVLIGILISAFLILIFFFGGSIVLLKRLFPGMQLPTPGDEVIKLNLKDSP